MTAVVRRFTCILVGAVLVGCTSTGPGTTPDVSAVASPISDAGNAGNAAACSPIELRTPGGARVDLTGTWRGRGAVHHIRQSGSCVWWIALSDFPGLPAGSAYSITFHGQIQQDFTLVGEWAFVVRPITPGTPPSGMERVTLTIDVDATSGEEEIVLRGPGGGPDTGGPVVDFYDAITMERVGPLPVGQ
jgi:hypothetical protein